MKPARSITPKDWMLQTECGQLMSVLNTDAGQPDALFVGGCVRNLLLGIPTEDLDIATKHKPDAVQKLCTDAGFKTIPTGIDHGTVTVVVDDAVFEVTTLRRDVSTDGRRATVEFSDDWREDATRRDFTMNTLLADLQGHIYDPTRQGISDLEAGKVVFVGAPEQRIQEDYLRILRLFRFHASYGTGEPEPVALAACQKFANKISVLSGERITQEFLKILMVRNLVNALVLMKNSGVLSDVLPTDPARLEEFVNRQNRFDLFHQIARFFVLFSDRLSTATTYFILSNKQKKFLERMEELQTSANEMSVKEVIYRYGRELAEQYFLMFYEEDALETTLKIAGEWEVPKLPVDGNDMQALGIKSGKSMGKYLDKTETWWIKNDFIPNKKDCLAYLQTLLG